MKIVISPKMIRRTVKEYFLITFGLFIYAFAWIGIIMPAGIVGGGTSGLALLIFYATGGEAGGGFPMAYSIFAINTVLIIIASFIIGFKFSAKTIYAVIMMSVAMGSMQAWLPYDVLGLAHDQLLSAILAGAIAGISLAICFTQGGSMGGTDIIAMIINKYRPISYGKVIMSCDLVIIGLSYGIGSEISTVIYSFLVIIVLGYTLDAVMAGNRQSSQVFIMSKKNDEIASGINHYLHRGVTMLDGTGWYSKQPVRVAMVVCRKNETPGLFRIIKDIDPEAFITVANVMGVYGSGFDALKMAKTAKKLPVKDVTYKPE